MVTIVNLGTAPPGSQFTRRSTCAEDDFVSINSTAISPDTDLHRREVLAVNPEGSIRQWWLPVYRRQPRRGANLLPLPMAIHHYFTTCQYTGCTSCHRSHLTMTMLMTIRGHLAQVLRAASLSALRPPARHWQCYRVALLRKSVIQFACH